ncbi:hypothetical protein KO317_03615 [Candidatus Micrarchaeota archaeon]|nr:hypothetical protein [Candidatus Micrarchaeota archaeon]
MEIRKTYLIKNGALKIDKLVEVIGKELNKDSFDKEIKKFDDEIRIHSNEALHKIKGRYTFSKEDKDLEAHISIKSKRSELVNVVFGLICLSMVYCLFVRYYISIISGLFGIVIFWLILEHLEKTAQKELASSLRDTLERACKKVELKID